MQKIGSLWCGNLWGNLQADNRGQLVGDAFSLSSTSIMHMQPVLMAFLFRCIVFHWSEEFPSCEAGYLIT